MPHSVVAVVADLFFIAKIMDAAKRAAVPIEFVKSEADAVRRASDGAGTVLVDLNCAGIDPVQLVKSLKAVGPIRVVGYVSHVNIELRRQALEAGYDLVVAKSALSQNLPNLLAADERR
jgi:DNA-binding NarL/FixJ family response regulator